MVLSIGTEVMRVTMYLAAPLLGTAMVVGIVVSVFQAVTQINESTLTFIPKMAAIIIVLMALAPWMLKTMTEYTTEVFSGIEELAK